MESTAVPSTSPAKSATTNPAPSLVGIRRGFLSISLGGRASITAKMRLMHTAPT